MPSIGPMELILFLVIVLVVFGPGKLPELGRALGRGISEFRQAASPFGSADRDPNRNDALTGGNK